MVLYHVLLVELAKGVGNHVSGSENESLIALSVASSLLDGADCGAISFIADRASIDAG